MTTSFSSSRSQAGVYHWRSGAWHERSIPGSPEDGVSRTIPCMGGDDTKAKLLAHHGAGLIQPQGKECLPNPEFLAWHRKEVFKEPARE